MSRGCWPESRHVDSRRTDADRLTSRRAGAEGESRRRRPTRVEAGGHRRARARMTSRSKKGQRGFTLIELMVVIVILGLLVGLVAPNVFRSTKEATIRAVTIQMSSIGQSITLFRAERRVLPRTLDELTQEDPRTREPFLDRLPNDPWGQAYVYRVIDEARGKYEISSSSEDRIAGTDDDLRHPEDDARR